MFRPNATELEAIENAVAELSRVVHQEKSSTTVHHSLNYYCWFEQSVPPCPLLFKGQSSSEIEFLFQYIGHSAWIRDMRVRIMLCY